MRQSPLLYLDGTIDEQMRERERWTVLLFRSLFRSCQREERRTQINGWLQSKTAMSINYPREWTEKKNLSIYSSIEVKQRPVDQFTRDFQACHSRHK